MSEHERPVGSWRTWPRAKMREAVTRNVGGLADGGSWGDGAGGALRRPRKTQERWVEKLAAVKLNRGVFNRGCSKKNVSFLKKYITSAASLVKATPQKKKSDFWEGGVSSDKTDQTGERSEKLTRERTPLCSQLATQHLIFFELWNKDNKKAKCSNVRGNQLKQMVISQESSCSC